MALGAQRRHHARVHAARKAQDHALVAHLRADRRNGVVDDRVHVPRTAQVRRCRTGSSQQLVAVRGVAHLGVELRCVQLPLRHIPSTPRGTCRSTAVTAKPSGTCGSRRRGGSSTRSARPACSPYSTEAPAVAASQAVPPRTRPSSVWPTVPPSVDGHDLLPVAEARAPGMPSFEDLGVERGRVIGVHARGPARQDDGRRGSQRAHFLGGYVARHDLGVHVQIAHAARDELPVLGSEIDDDDFLAGRRGAHGRLLRIGCGLRQRYWRTDPRC